MEKETVQCSACQKQSQQTCAEPGVPGWEMTHRCPHCGVITYSEERAQDLEVKIYEIHSQNPIQVNMNQKSVGEVEFRCGCPGFHLMQLFTASNYDEFIVCRNVGIRGSCNTVFASAVFDELAIDRSIPEFGEKQ